MESKKILEILKQFSENDTYSKIFINGAWGIGKSYYTNKFIQNKSNNFAYVSLFGKSNFESIEIDLAKQLMKKLNGIKKSAKTIKNFIKKLSASVSFKGFSISSPELERKSLISEYSSLLDSKQLIIVIDDLERKSGNIFIEDIMGIIEEFSQFNKVKLVIIGDENNMNCDDKTKWKKFKEKIIDKEFKITKFSNDSIDNIVNNEVCEYIESNEIENFINMFIKKHKINNLRTIIKGINLFKEIINNFIDIKNNKQLNLMLLKNCMSVAIECTENIYQPCEENKKRNPFQYAIDEEITSRIIHHYFNSININNSDTCALYYVLKIYNCDYDDDTIKEFNDILNGYLNIKVEEKNIFYLSEKQITNKIFKLYNRIKNNKYNYSSLDKLIDDFYEICNWNDEFELQIDLDEISLHFNKILFLNFYSIEKNLYKNKIDRFQLKRRESLSLSKIIDNFNNAVDIKYSNDKFAEIKKSFENNECNEDLLEWLESRLIQDDKKIIMEHFINLCRENKYLIPDLSCEINDNIWSWTHKIWKLFYEKMAEEYKNELNEYVETLKNNKLSTYRINALQQYRPLVKSN